MGPGGMNEVFDRIESTLRRCAARPGWEDQRVSAAAMLELMEHVAALLRQIGATADAERLDEMRRDFLNRAGSRLLQQAPSQRPSLPSG
jgi:hypothetical protein